ncbi:MAG: arginase family protein [Thermoleophilaceae bacterium]|nr:arginase family protein [Thermoleophilaceae bacterium]
MEGSLRPIHLACRIAERAEAPVRGAEVLAEKLGARTIGSGASARETGWEEDLRDARGCLLEAGGQVEDALAAGDMPLLISSDCAVGLTTLAAALRDRPEARVLWLDAHGDYNTPGTTSSNFLGGMGLSGAVGEWDSGLAEPVAAERVVIAGVRDLDPPERELLERSAVTVIGASLETLVYTQNAIDGAPVFVHLDLDVLDPEDHPAWMPAENGLRADKVYDLLEAVADESEILGLTVTDADPDPRAVDVALHVMDPLLAGRTVA